MNAVNNIRKLINRELNSLSTEIDQYPDEADLWQTADGIRNPAGTLILHICGNLRHYIGARLGQSGYVRDRDNEFCVRDVSRKELKTETEKTLRVVNNTLNDLTDEVLDYPFPEKVGGKQFSTGLFLMHLCSHLAYHIGQINYHRRMITADNGAVQPLAISGIDENIE